MWYVLGLGNLGYTLLVIRALHMMTLKLARIMLLEVANCRFRSDLSACSHQMFR